MDSGRDQSNETTSDKSVSIPRSHTRLSVNLNPEAAEALKEYTEKRHISYTEAIRRAIAVLKFIDDQISAGRDIQIADGDSVQKVVLVS